MWPKERIRMAAEAEASGIVVDARNIFRDHFKYRGLVKQYYLIFDVTW